MRALVVGGSSGLGMELVKLLQVSHTEILITGFSSENPFKGTHPYIKLNLKSEKSPNYKPEESLDAFLDALYKFGVFNTVVYNACYYQEGRIDKLQDFEILDMAYLGFIAAARIIRKIILNQKRLDCLVAITSTSQYTPREFEPVYSSVKAALGMLANSLSLDPRIAKTLVVAPSGMKTKFWNGTDKDTSRMLEPSWVAEQVIKLLKGNFKYRSIKILRNPAHYEIEETRIR